MRFFAMVQESASELGKVFFIDDAEPRETWVDGMHAEDMFGWLVPNDLADVFETKWMSAWRTRSHPNRLKWLDFFVLERWHLGEDGKLSVSFDKVEPVSF
ncbi:MAG: hypothetical protein IJ092_00825 [Atopobiaceae bacterium]|nr:hypothetical protein [Atopobiaceae bacterium]